MQIPKSIQKYLAKQSIHNCDIEVKGSGLYNNILVIPALDELNNVQVLIKSLSLNSSQHFSETLILFIVNNLVLENSDIIEKNRKLLIYLREQILINSKLNLGVIDASSVGKELPTKNGGVGLARKIGMDLALSYFDFTNKKKKIFISLDADCLVSENYLESIIDQFNRNNFQVALVNFEHILPKKDQQKAAIVNYEIFLRYYVLGLRYANSPFAFPSVGSIIACDVESYVKIGGMNKRKAGEDFYFLEKLAKVSQIHRITNATVFPSSRISERVPFGTGARIKRFVSNTQNEYVLYSPKNFEILRKWLELFFSIEIKHQTHFVLTSAIEINSKLYDFLIEQNFKSDWDNILKNSKSEIQLNKQKNNWMDGFRTLKLIHYLRDNENPNKDMFEAINNLLESMNVNFDYISINQIPSLEIQLKYLELLRSLT
jgi:hypothetical protein